MDEQVKIADECLNYLTDKIENLNLNKKIHKGFRILRTIYDIDKEQLQKFINYAILRLHIKFKEDKNKKLPYTTPLTAYIIRVGTYVLSTFPVEGLEFTGDEDMFHEERANLGAAILEPMVYLGYVEIEEDKYFSIENIRKSPPKIIYATDKWIYGARYEIKEMAMMGKSFYPYHKTTSLTKGRNGPNVVKHNHDEEYFKEMLGTDFVRGVDTLQRTAWRINHDVYHSVMVMHLNQNKVPVPKKGSKKLVDDARKELELQTKLRNKGKPNTYENALKEFEHNSKVWATKRAALKVNSKIMEQRAILNAAEYLYDADKFYIQVSADYRGRYYYDSPFLNYQGSDLGKALLEFSSCREVTEKGLRWMKIYAAVNYNQTYSINELKHLDWITEDYVSYLKEHNLEDISVDKMSLNDRVSWTDNNMFLIEQTANNGTYIDDAEKPFLFLATTIDLINYYKAKAFGKSYYSNLPIAVDGTCNGIQHTAAINKDKLTGSLVGLTLSNIPKDIYMIVGKKLRNMEEDYFNQRSTMKMKDIRKNFSKVAVMTRSYSAGKKSIAEGMFGECHKNEATTKFNITSEDCLKIAKTSISAIDLTCPSTETTRSFLDKVLKHELGDFEWFDDNGEIVSGKRNNIRGSIEKLNSLIKSIRNTKKRIKSGSIDNSVYKNSLNFIFKSLKVDPINEESKILEFLNVQEPILVDERTKLYEEIKVFKLVKVSGNGSKEISWTTPSGFKVKYSHFLKEDKDFRVRINGKRYHLSYKKTTNKVDIEKHASAIAANFIHSMDASHTSKILKTWNECGGHSFGAVHDSFAVHASDVDFLIEVIKETFIELYKDNNFYEEWIVNNILSSNEDFEEELPEIGELDLNEIYKSDYFFS